MDRTEDNNDLLLESLEIATGHVQRGQVADQAGLEEAVSAMPDHLVSIDQKAPTPCAFITGIAGSGKCLGRGTPVLLYSGHIVPVESVQEGQLLMGPDSKPRTVLSTTSGRGPLYKITPIKGDPYVVNDEHILVVEMSSKGVYKNQQPIDMPLQVLLNAGKSIKKNAKGVRVGVDFPETIVPLDPYILGLWLGDRSIEGPLIHKPDPEIREALEQFADAHGFIVRPHKHADPKKCISFYVGDNGPDGGRPNSNRFTKLLKQVGVFGNKHIPHFYKANSAQTRLQVLAGLLDTNGYYSSGYYEITSVFKCLAEDVAFVARSLGLAAYVKEKTATCQVPDFVGTYYRVTISGHVDKIPCRIARKKASPRKQIKDVLRTGIMPTRLIGHGEYFGFTLDGDGRFLLGDFTVTHNSFTCRERCAADPNYAILSSSTGISAINLNTVTVHSLLGFFDTDSLRDAYIQGGVQRRLRKLVTDGYRNVIIDECSMISRETLDLLVRSFDDVNGRLLSEDKPPVGLILTGDWLQLPAIADKPAGAGAGRAKRGQAAKIPWGFHSQFWQRFEKNTTKLTKVWRQSDPRFLAALNFARAGRGRDCLQVFQSVGQKFESFVDNDFEGSTIVGKNDEVDRINQIRLDRVKGRPIALPSRRWAAGGKVRTEWKHIPERTIIRENCYVMLLANKYVEGAMVYANGDCGWVRGIQPSIEKMVPPSILVELVRTSEVVQVESLVRGIEHGDRPDWISGDWEEQTADEDGKFCARPHYRKAKRRHVTGQIEYYPLRVAYASTVHRSQGLSLDKVQVDFRGWMYRSPAMLYTALSRCRTLEGLRLVGMPEMLVERCKVDPEVLRWL